MDNCAKGIRLEILKAYVNDIGAVFEIVNQKF